MRDNRMNLLNFLFWLCFLAMPSSLLASTPKVLLLGDSITEGRDSANQIPYRVPLWNLLVAANLDVDFVGSESSFFGGINNPGSYPGFDFDHEGHWGWEAGEIASSLPTWLQQYDADYALIHLGTNDIDRSQTVASTILELQDIITLLRGDNPEITVLLAQIIPMQVMTGRRDLTEFNQEVATLASSLTTSNSPVIAVDQHTGYDPSIHSYDFYHPNAVGAELMAQNWFNTLEPLLSAQDETNVNVPMGQIFSFLFLLLAAYGVTHLQKNRNKNPLI